MQFNQTWITQDAHEYNKVMRMLVSNIDIAWNKLQLRDITIGIDFKKSMLLSCLGSLISND